MPNPALVLLFLLGLPAPARGVTAVGRVVDGAGRPIAGARVALRRSFQQGADDTPYRATTGADGRFAVPHLAFSPADLAIQAAGFRPLSVPSLALPQDRANADLGRFSLAPGQTVAGQVTDPAGQPVAGAEVWEVHEEIALQGADGTALGPAAVAGPDGRFALQADPRGGSFRVRGDGYLEARLSFKGAPRAPLAVVLHRPGRVAGQVLAADGTPIAAAKLELSVPRAPYEYPRQAQTDDAGRFELSPLPAGWYDLHAEADGFLPAVERRLRVEEGGAVAGIEIRLLSGAVVTGRVTTPDGEPLPGVQVSAWGTGGEAVTDGDGVYRMSGVPARRVLVRASLASPRQEGFTESELAAQPGENRLDLVLTTKKKGLHEVRGRVVAEDGSPLAGVRITTDGETVVDAFTGDDGTFVVQELDGEHFLAATREGFVKGVIDVTVAGADVSGLELRLERTGAIVGRILGLDADDLRKTTVSVFSEEKDPEPHTTYPDLSGHYRIAGLDPREYSVRAVSGARSAEGSVTLAAGSEARLDLTFPDRFELRGRVVDADGGPLAGAWIGAVPFDEGDDELRATAAEDGTFALAVVNGKYRLRAGARGFLTRSEGPIEVAGAAVDGLELALVPGATVHGRVLGLHPGDPAKVKAQGPGGEEREGEVADDGTYRIEDLGPGEWQVTAALAADLELRLYPVTRAVTVPAGPAERVLDLPLDLGDVTLLGQVSPTSTYRTIHLLSRAGTVPEQTLDTHGDGTFRFPRLHPGTYLLRVEGTSFEQELELPTGVERVEINLELPPEENPEDRPPSS